jgi:hypothetical protein
VTATQDELGAQPASVNAPPVFRNRYGSIRDTTKTTGPELSSVSQRSSISNVAIILAIVIATPSQAVDSRRRPRGFRRDPLWGRSSGVTGHVLSVRRLGKDRRPFVAPAMWAG